VIVALAIGGAELLLMILMSVYGAVTLPPDARVPVHWGGTWGNFRSKRAGLVIWPGAGAGLFVLLTFVGGLRSHGQSAAGAIRVLLPIVMCVLLVAQAGAIMTARRRSGSAA
jgi:hypothetical protein